MAEFPSTEFLDRLNSTLGSLRKDFGGLGGNLDLAAGAMGTLTDAMLQANQIALGTNRIGVSLTELNRQTLTQGILGVAKTEATAAALQTGLRGNTYEINRLFTRMKLTGQDMGAMLGTLRSLDITTGMSIAQLELVSREARDLGSSFGMSSEKIIAAVASMGKLVERVGLVGLGTNREATANFSKALMQVTTALGPGMEAKLKASMELLSEGSARGLVRASQLGIAGQRNIFFDQNVTSRDLIRILRRSGDATNTLVNSLTGTGDKFFGLQKAMDILGSNNIGALVQVNEKLQEAMESGRLEEVLDVGARMDQMTTTLRELGERFIGPVRDFLVQVGPTFMVLTKAVIILWQAIWGAINTILKVFNMFWHPVIVFLDNTLSWTGIFDGMSASLKSIDEKTVDQTLPTSPLDMSQHLNMLINSVLGLGVTGGTHVQTGLMSRDESTKAIVKALNAIPSTTGFYNPISWVFGARRP